VALADRRALRHAIDHVTSAGTELELRIRDESDPWTVSLRAAHTAPRTLVVAFTPRKKAQYRRVVPRKRAPRPSDRIERFAFRFPHAVVALRPDGTVAFANGRARAFFGRDSVRVGVELGDDIPRDIRILAFRLIQHSAPLHPTVVELSDTRTVRVSGLAATQEEPAILFLEDITEQQKHERVTREFLRNAAHQIRTPLTGIAAAIETLQAGAKNRPEERDRFLGHLETHAARLTRIARGLLLLARAQTGEQFRVDYVRLAPLLEEAAAAVEPREGVEIGTSCEEGIAALASPELLREALAALVENAVSHTDAGTIRLAAASTNGQVALSVADSGGGVLPEFRNRIFEPFYRVADDGRGYGLGLAIAAQAVRAMGGTIDVSETPGGGTTFTVRLQSATTQNATV
jgi:signal transduction histidine kinase